MCVEQNTPCFCHQEEWEKFAYRSHLVGIAPVILLKRWLNSTDYGVVAYLRSVEVVYQQSSSLLLMRSLSSWLRGSRWKQ